MQAFKSISEFKSALLTNPALQDEFKQDPLKAVEGISETPLVTDKWIYRIVVSSLGATILAIIIGTLFLIGSDDITGDKTVPTILTAIGSAAIGALAGLLAPSPTAARS